MDSELYIDLIGKPFKTNCKGPKYYDCFGLVYEIYRRAGIVLPDVNKMTFKDYEGISEELDRCKSFYKRIDNPEPGCLVTFRANSKLVTHVGVIIDHCRMIHTREGIGVNIVRFDSPVWKAKLEGFYKYE
jgi:cell wall-associated NlpC family hydrolase